MICLKLTTWLEAKTVEGRGEREDPVGAWRKFANRYGEGGGRCRPDEKDGEGECWTKGARGSRDRSCCSQTRQVPVGGSDGKLASKPAITGELDVIQEEAICIWAATVAPKRGTLECRRGTG